MLPSLMIFCALSFAVRHTVDTDGVGDIAVDFGSGVVAQTATGVFVEAAEDVD
jgi:hypothetical protein